jgi:hypothetical protein
MHLKNGVFQRIETKGVVKYRSGLAYGERIDNGGHCVPGRKAESSRLKGNRFCLSFARSAFNDHVSTISEYNA